MRFPEVTLQVCSMNVKQCSYHPSVRETWRKDQEVICPKAIVSNQVLLGCEEPDLGVLRKTFALYALLALWYPR